MEIDDIPKVEGYLNDMEESLRSIKTQIRRLNEAVENLLFICRDEPELYDLVRRESRYISQLQRVVDGFPIVRLVRRRLLSLETRIKMRNEDQKREDAHVRKMADNVQESVEDILKKFLS